MPARTNRAGSFLTLGDLEEAAERAVEPGIWGYIQGGAGAERAVRASEAAFERWSLVPDALHGVRSVDLRTTLLGTEVAAPFFVAPTAYHGEVHGDAERGTAAAAAAVGVLGVYSTLSSNSLEEIARAAGDGPRWFQLYLQPTVEGSIELVHRAEAAGYSAIVVTVDTPVLGSRDRQERTGFALRGSVSIGNGPEVRSPARGPTWDGGPYALAAGGDVSWEALAAVRAATKLPLVVKGVLRPELARRAVDAGARAVVVSNHGGRQLDLAVPPLEALPAVVAAVGESAEVYVDGGVRRGSDVVLALALGARAVGIGRPVLWALAAGGRAGVEQYLRLFGTEVANSFLLVGRARPVEVDRSVIAPAGTPPAAERPPRSLRLPRHLEPPRR